MRKLIWIIIFFISFSCSSHYTQLKSYNRTIEKVPFYPQNEYQCGPATLASVMNYHGIDITPEQIVKDIFSKTARGTLTFDMVNFVKNRGLKVDYYSSSLDDLKANINTGNPLIVLVDYGFLSYQQNHFMVVIGYNDYGVIVNSDSFQGQFITNENFVKVWKKTNFWTLLIKKD